MHARKQKRSSRHHTCKILVIDEDDLVANTVAAMLPRGSCEIISCSDMAVAEMAMDMTDFDLILVAPRSTGVDGFESLAVADFVMDRNPSAVAAFMVPRADLALKAAAARRSVVSVLDNPPRESELASLLNCQLAVNP